MNIGKLILHNRLSILSQFRVEIMCYNNLVVILPTHQLESSADWSPHRQYSASPMPSNMQRDGCPCTPEPVLPSRSLTWAHSLRLREIAH